MTTGIARGAKPTTIRGASPAGSAKLLGRTQADQLQELLREARRSKTGAFLRGGTFCASRGAGFHSKLQRYRLSSTGWSTRRRASTGPWQCHQQASAGTATVRGERWGVTTSEVASRRRSGSRTFSGTSSWTTREVEQTIRVGAEAEVMVVVQATEVAGELEVAGVASPASTTPVVEAVEA